GLSIVESCSDPFAVAAPSWLLQPRRVSAGPCPGANAGMCREHDWRAPAKGCFAKAVEVNKVGPEFRLKASKDAPRVRDVLPFGILPFKRQVRLDQAHPGLMQHGPLICARARTQGHKGDAGAGFRETRGEAAGISPHPTHRVGGHQDPELR